MISKKQTVESTNEEPLLVRFILKLKLLHLLFERGIPFQYPVPYDWSDYESVPYYWAGYSRVKSSTLTVNLGDQETQVGERATLLTFLTIVKEKTPEVGFLLELLVGLTLYHCICDMYKTYKLFNQEDEMKAKIYAAMARTTALYEDIFGDLMDVEG